MGADLGGGASRRGYLGLGDLSVGELSAERPGGGGT